MDETNDEKIIDILRVVCCNSDLPAQHVMVCVGSGRLNIPLSQMDVIDLGLSFQGHYVIGLCD